MSDVVLDLKALTEEQRRGAATSAERLLREPLLAAILDRMQENSSIVAMNGETAVAREEARQFWLAVDRLRASLKEAINQYVMPIENERRARAYE